MSQHDGGDTRNIGCDVHVWAKAHYGDRAEVSGVRRLPGHSGINYVFSISTDGLVEELVLRVPPIGVQRRANLDVVRFVPVLRLAEAGGVPVPTVRWFSEDEQWFGTPYLMVSRVAGAPLADTFEAGQHYPATNEVRSVFRQALSALAAIHALDTTELIQGAWAVPVTREEDLAQWVPLLRKSEVPGEVRRTLQLGQELLRTAPSQVSPCVVHGDFYSNNWMLDQGRLTAVLDWENATLNDPGWDLGWLATIYDPQCWGPARAPWMTWHPTAEQFYGWYEAASGRRVQRPNWYQALMCYRLAAIVPAKVRLHRTGRRVDPIWEVFAEAIPYQLDRAFALLGQES